MAGMSLRGFWVRRRTVILAALLALLVLLGLISGVVVFTAALVAIWGLVFLCSRYVRKAGQGYGRLRVAAGLRYNLCAFSVLYLIPIGIATAFYVLLAAYISFFGNSLSINWLITLQRAFETVSKFFADNLKLSEVKVLIVLVAAYVLSCVLLFRWRRAARSNSATAGGGSRRRIRVRVVEMVHRAVDVYCKYSGPIAAGLATLASFTFFGMHLGEPSQDLQLRIKIAQEGYAELTKKAEADLTERVAAELYVKIRDSFPQSYRDALALPDQVDNQVSDVRSYAENAQRQHGVTLPNVNQLVQRETARITSVWNLGSEWRVTGGEQPRQAVEARAPGDATPNQVKAAKSAVDSRPQSRGAEIFAEGEKKIFLQVEKLVSERLVEFTKPVTSAIPILEPLLQSFVEAADKTLQERMEKASDRIAEAVRGNPSDLSGTIEREATRVVADTDVRGPVERATPVAERRASELRQTASALGASKVEIDDRVAQKLIGDLASPNESVRTGAVEQLARMGSGLNGQRVADLASIMRTGRQSWSESYKPPGGHCTDITTTSIRYYAADALQKVSSSNVSPQLREEASAAKSSAVTKRRVLEPGWICFY
jgi:hypothetical protein